MNEFERLAAIFDRKNADGTFHYSDADVRHWLPLIIIACGFAVETWTEEMREAMTQLAVNARLDADDPRTVEKINAYYTRFPVNPELARELAALTGDITLEQHEVLARKAFAALRSVGAGAPPDVMSARGLAPPTSSGATRRRNHR